VADSATFKIGLLSKICYGEESADFATESAAVADSGVPIAFPRLLTPVNAPLRAHSTLLTGQGSLMSPLTGQNAPSWAHSLVRDHSA